MCGISGILDLKGRKHAKLRPHLRVMNKLQAHRGPDGQGTWTHPQGHVGFGHRRLSIIDLETGAQPMSDASGNVICCNGEIYNYIELRDELHDSGFRTSSDTEVILAAYRKWGIDCLARLRGMFAFALWDETKQTLFCARDHFGIKPFYYVIEDGVFYFASEAKALLPFLPEIETDQEALKDYLVFQFCLAGKTLFEGINELPPAHLLLVENGRVSARRYWEVYYNLDFSHSQEYFQERLRGLIEDSIRVHTRSDVPIGAYLSGGTDSTIITSVASRFVNPAEFPVFTGKFAPGESYDESRYARIQSKARGLAIHEIEITASDFEKYLRKLLYHLDYPIAGPGSLPQYIVSRLASRHRKVVLGGQGGDEIFGGYVRYLIAYFEQCIKGAIENTLHSGNFVVTYESIIPNLVALQNYKPLLQQFWRQGLFEGLDRRYFRLIDRGSDLQAEVRWNVLGERFPFERFQAIFNRENVGKESYFDKMTHFDFKTLLPALLQVEDRMSMAHGLESRVPFLDHPLVEFAATMPANIKFKNGTLKTALVEAMKHEIPD
ncbi:MAG: asparagine synthase (glutamine-hydrolyzing), partial [Planctomycetota bacterium]|nr:asparagine synthase (glutamine-hydrolyzing) [Planctomycetota bacterium]